MMISHMEFECKLAHEPTVKTIGGFNSLKDLYGKISESFELKTSEILFCTLNSHNPRSMDNLLANYLSMGDKIIVHLVGKSETFNLVKTQPHLGLTITDNGQGRAFVKRVHSEDGIIENHIQPGDHIAAIDGNSSIGMRHYEVAKALRQIELNSSFSIQIIRPLLCDNKLYQELLRMDALHNQHDHHNHNHDVDKSIDNGNNRHIERSGKLDDSSTNNNGDGSHHASAYRHEAVSLFEAPNLVIDGGDDDRILVSNKTATSDYLSLDDLADTSLPLDRLLSKTNDNSSIKVKKLIHNN